MNCRGRQVGLQFRPHRPKQIVSTMLSRTVTYALALAGCFLAEHTILIASATAGESEPTHSHSLIHRPGSEFDRTGQRQDAASSTSSASKSSSEKPAAAPGTATPLQLHRKLSKRPSLSSTQAPIGTGQTSGTVMTPKRLPTGSLQPHDVPSTSQGTSTAPPLASPPPQASPTGGAAVAGIAPLSSAPRTTVPLANAAGAQSLASTGTGSSSPVKGGSRSALSLFQNSSIASLLQPPIPTVAPPVTPPSNTIPTAPPPPSPNTGSATISWTLGNEPDLAGYRIHIGTASGTYSYPGSPITIGRVGSYTVANLPKGFTYYFALEAYDTWGNASPLSAEVSKSIY